MSDPVSNTEIEDVLSSIRRLVSVENRTDEPPREARNVRSGEAGGIALDAPRRGFGANRKDPAAHAAQNRDFPEDDGAFLWDDAHAETDDEPADYGETAQVARLVLTPSFRVDREDGESDAQASQDDRGTGDEFAGGEAQDHAEDYGHEQVPDDHYAAESEQETAGQEPDLDPQDRLSLTRWQVKGEDEAKADHHADDAQPDQDAVAQEDVRQHEASEDEAHQAEAETTDDEWSFSEPEAQLDDDTPQEDWQDESDQRDAQVQSEQHEDAEFDQAADQDADEEAQAEAEDAQIQEPWDETPPEDDPVDDVEMAEDRAPSELEAKIAEVEAAVAARDDQWEPDGASDDAYAGSQTEPLPWEDHVAKATTLFEAAARASDAQVVELPDEEHEAAAPVKDRSVAPQDSADQDAGTQNSDQQDAEAQPASAGAENRDASDRWYRDEPDAILDEDALRDLVSEIVRQELQGSLGERITRNVRKLVRREIHRAMMGQDLD